MPQIDPDALARYVERFALTLADTGIPRMPARVFAALMTSHDGRLTAAELAETLSVSPAAISGAVRYLAQAGLVSREREPGSRRDHYVLHDDVLWQSLLRRDHVIRQWVETMADGRVVVGPDSPAGRRLEESRAFLAYLMGELPALLEKWKALRAAERADAGASA